MDGNAEATSRGARFDMMTAHARERLKQRAFADKQQAKRLAKLAFRHGVPPAMTGEPLQSWLLDVQRGRGKNTTKVKLYNGFVYVFRNKKLVTAYELPERFRLQG